MNQINVNVCACDVIDENEEVIFNCMHIQWSKTIRCNRKFSELKVKVVREVTLFVTLRFISIAELTILNVSV